MKNINSIFKSIFILSIIALGFASCSEPDAWSKVPDNVSNFLQQYWPGSELTLVSTSKDGECNVTIKNGPSLKFNASGSWTEINGNGSTLPSELLYDQLPDRFYKYIQEMEATNGVYSLKRNSDTYEAGLQNTTLTYNIATGETTFPRPKAE